MGSTYPSSLDNFAESSPANLGDSDTTGRTHSERHDDVEAAMEAVQSYAVSRTLVDAKGDLLAGTAADTVARLPVGTVGQMLAVDADATSGMAWRSPGVTNLLTRNQASLEDGTTTGFAATTNCSLAASTTVAASGTYSLAVTSSAAGAVVAGTPVTAAGSPPVTPGKVYSAALSARSAAITSSLTPRIRWWTAAGAAVSTSNGTAVAVATGSWTQYWVTVAAPATAAYATVEVTWTAAGASEVVYLDKVGLWEGYGGSWAMPGDPIPNLGVRWDESVGRRAFMWDSVNAREQMVYGDTGLRDVSASLINSWAGSLYIRREAWTVSVYGLLTKDSASDDAAFLIPSGFRPQWGGNTFSWSSWNAAVGAQVASWVDGSQNIALNRAEASTGSGVTRLGTSWTTADAWPSSLPGSASGSIPSA